ncbi:MAG: hypothetical protein U9R26_05140 [Campylobacterota bacterium]|nr:hypothetical protein [Campylobacterota bacterium]
MKKIVLFSALALPSLIALTGCSGKTEVVSANPYKMQKSCENMEQSLVKLEEYILRVENTSAFHLEEAAQAYEVPDVTTSTNKKQMLKDARNYRDELIGKYENKQCPERKKRS